MTERDNILRKCQDAFPGMEQKPDMAYSVRDLELSSLNSHNTLLKQRELAKELGFPNGDNLIDRAVTAKACSERFQEKQDDKDMQELVEGFERRLADSVLHGAKESFVLRLGTGIPRFSNRIMSYEPPALSDRQKSIVDALSERSHLDVQIKQMDPARNEFWIAIKRKGH